MSVTAVRVAGWAWWAWLDTRGHGLHRSSLKDYQKRQQNPSSCPPNEEHRLTIKLNIKFGQTTPIKEVSISIMSLQYIRFHKSVGLKFVWLNVSSNSVQVCQQKAPLSVKTTYTCRVRAFSHVSVGFLANVHVRYMLSPVRPSVCRLSLCNVRAPYSGGSNCVNISTALGILATHWHPLKISRR